MSQARVSWSADPRIEAASAFVADLPLCQVRLQDDTRWPWLVLLPRQVGAREIDDLDELDRSLLLQEVVPAMDLVRALGVGRERPVEKLNVGALGNVVAQLHVHVVGRRLDDPAWPGPVWGFGEALRHDAGELRRLTEGLQLRLAGARRG